MSTIYLSPIAGGPLIEYLQNLGHRIRFMQPVSNVAAPVACHPDMCLCKLGTCDESPVFYGNTTILDSEYPDDVRYNACCTGRYFIHNLKYTAPELLHACHLTEYTASDASNPASKNLHPVGAAAPSILPSALTAVHVSQGYARCSIIPVTETSIITYDQGITKACRKAGLEVLLIRPGHVLLPGYREGFIGGTCGRIGNQILFNGDLSAHPDFDAIRTFIEEKGLSCVWFDSYPLTDIGSIILDPNDSPDDDLQNQ